MIRVKSTSRLLLVLALSVGCDARNDTGPDGQDKAFRALAGLNSAEIDYLEKDLDKNGIRDFWTGDVSGLFQYGLIPREVAEADAFPLHPLVKQPKAYHGYLFVSLEWDDSEQIPENLLQDTDEKSGKVHHKSRFAFCAFPAATGENFRWIYLRGYGGDMGVVLGRKTKGVEPVRRWPNAKERSAHWAIID